MDTGFCRAQTLQCLGRGRLRWRAAAALTFRGRKQYAISEEMQYPFRDKLPQLEQTGFWEHSPFFFFFFPALHKSFCLEGLSIYGNLEIPHLERKRSSSAALGERRGSKLLRGLQGRLVPKVPGIQLGCACQGFWAGRQDLHQLLPRHQLDSDTEDVESNRITNTIHSNARCSSKHRPRLAGCCVCISHLTFKLTAPPCHTQLSNRSRLQGWRHELELHGLQKCRSALQRGGSGPVLTVLS